MAEGGDLTSIKDGSDADFDVVCTPCGEGNIREESVKYCPDCQEYLCTTCTIHHGRQKATRSHKLLNRETAKQGSVIAMTTKCRYRPDRDIEMYCAGHDMVYCLKCIATDHRACSGVTGIEEIEKTSVQQKEVELLQNETIKVQERLADANKKKQENIVRLEKQRDEIFTEIEDDERRLIEHIGKLKRETVSILNRDYTLNKEKLKSSITIIATMKKDTEKAGTQLHEFNNMDAAQQFVQMKLIQHTINGAVKLVDDIEAKGRKALCFTENTALKTSIITAKSLGQVNTVIESDCQNDQRIYKVKSKKKINIKMQNDCKTCQIADVCQLLDGTIILADYINRKIKRLDINYNIKDHCDLGSYPTGICCTGQNEVAMKMENNKVQFISVGSSLSKLRKIPVNGGDYWGMAYHDGELWISTKSGVNVYSTSGTLLKTISKDVNDRRVFKSGAQHMAICGETVIVTDQGDRVVCLGRDYTVQRELRDGRLDDTTGVCVSGDGTVFLSGYRSNNIVMFAKNWKCLGELVGKDACLMNPISLQYDDKKKCIILTCDFSNEIIVFAVSS